MEMRPSSWVLLRSRDGEKVTKKPATNRTKAKTLLWEVKTPVMPKDGGIPVDGPVHGFQTLVQKWHVKAWQFAKCMYKNEQLITNRGYLIENPRWVAISEM